MDRKKTIRKGKVQMGERSLDFKGEVREELVDYAEDLIRLYRYRILTSEYQRRLAEELVTKIVNSLREGQM